MHCFVTGPTECVIALVALMGARTSATLSAQWDDGACVAALGEQRKPIVEKCSLLMGVTIQSRKRWKRMDSSHEALDKQQTHSKLELSYSHKQAVSVLLVGGAAPTSQLSGHQSRTHLCERTESLGAKRVDVSDCSQRCKKTGGRGPMLHRGCDQLHGCTYEIP